VTRECSPTNAEIGEENDLMSTIAKNYKKPNEKKVVDTVVGKEAAVSVRSISMEEEVVTGDSISVDRRHSR